MNLVGHDDDFSDTLDLSELDIAIAHWHVNSWGGAEYLVTKLAESLGVKRVYTLGKPNPNDKNPYGEVIFEDVTPTLDYSILRKIQRLGGRIFEYAQWEDVDWREFGDPDILVTSGATTRAVITPDYTLHVNYCHSPPRWFYDLYHDRKKSISGVFARPLLRYLRTRDMTVDPRTDHYFVNSPIIKRRLWKYYKRDSEVLYPPVYLEKYYDDGDCEFFLYLGRLDKEKGISEVVEAFSDSVDQLVIAGGAGDVDDEVLREIDEAPNIEWRGFVEEAEKRKLLSTCTAVVFNGRNEDFGIVPIEANASGKPVLARNEGFPGIFVTDGKNGYLHDGTAIGIRKAVDQLKSTRLTVDPSEHVSCVSYERFEDQLRTSLLMAYKDHQQHVRQ